MNKIKIAFDLDDILIDTIPAWLNALNERHGTNKKSEDIKSWSISNFFKDDIEKGIITKEEIYYPLFEDDFWKTVKPIEGMYNSLVELKNLNDYEIYIVTASNYQTIKSKLDNCVLKYYGDIISSDNIIIANDKSMINAGILVDDYFRNINNFLKRNPRSIGIIKDTPHSDIDYDALDNKHLAENCHLNNVVEFTNSYNLLSNIIIATHNFW